MSHLRLEPWTWCLQTIELNAILVFSSSLGIAAFNMQYALVETLVYVNTIIDLPSLLMKYLLAISL